MVSEPYCNDEALIVLNDTECSSNNVSSGYYYDAQLASCEQFTYGLCPDNVGNLFDTKQHCESECAAVPRKFRRICCSLY